VKTRNEEKAKGKKEKGKDLGKEGLSNLEGYEVVFSFPGRKVWPRKGGNAIYNLSIATTNKRRLFKGEEKVRKT